MKIAVILTAMDKMSAVVNTAVSKTQRRLNSLSKGLDSFGNKALIAGGLGTVFFAKSLQAAEESEVAQNRLRQVFKSMGQDYETATRMSEQYASSLQMQIGQEDELILAVQAKIATFENAANAAARANGIYNRATAAAFDMQAAGFGEATQNAVQLGKALQDPVKGINALSRSGITFTAAEKKKIEALIKTNKVFEAQNIIMSAIEKQVGGVAEETVTKTQLMRVAWGEVMERIGNGLLPYFTRFANFMLDKVIPAVTSFVDKHPGLVKWLAVASGALLVIGTVAKTASFAFGLLSGTLGFLAKAFRVVVIAVMWLSRLMLANPIIAIAAAIGAAVFLIIKNWSKIKAFFTRLWNGVKDVFRTAWKVIKDIALAPYYAVRFLWGGIKSFFSGLWNGVKNTAAAIWKTIGDAITAPIRFIMKAWQDFKAWFRNLFGGINTQVDKLIEKSMKAQNMANMEKMKKMASLGSQTPSQVNVRHIMAGIMAPEKTATVSPVPVAARNNNTNLTYSPTINMGSGEKTDIMNVLKQNSRDVLKMMDEANRRRDRTKF